MIAEIIGKLKPWQYFLIAWILITISKGFFDEAGRKLLNWILRNVSPHTYGKRIFNNLDKQIKEVYSLSKDTLITVHDVVKSRDENSGAWSEVKVNDFDSSDEISEALMRLTSDSALYKIKRFLNKELEQALNLAMLESMAKEKGLDISTQIKDRAAEKEINKEYKIMKKIVNDKDMFRLLKEEGIRRSINLEKYGKDTLETSKSQFVEMIYNISDVNGDVDVVRIGKHTTYASVKNRVKNNKELEAIYLLARGSNKEKLKEFEKKLEDEFDAIWPPKTENRTYHNWKIDGSEYGSITLKLDINSKWRT